METIEDAVFGSLSIGAGYLLFQMIIFILGALLH